MPTKRSSLYDPKKKYVTKNYYSDNLCEGMLERLDDWSQFEQFQIGCDQLVKVFSAWETSRYIREKPEEWSLLKNPTNFANWQKEHLQRGRDALVKLTNMISQMNAETEKHWEAINRDSYFKDEQNQ